MNIDLSGSDVYRVATIGPYKEGRGIVVERSLSTFEKKKNIKIKKWPE